MAASLVLQDVAGSYEQYQKEIVVTKLNHWDFLLVQRPGICKIIKVSF